MRVSLWVSLLGVVCVSAASLAAQPINCDPDAVQALTGRGFYFSADTPRWQEFIPTRAIVCEVSVVLRVDHFRGHLFLHIEDDSGTVLGQSQIDEDQLVLGTGEYVFQFDTVVTPDQFHRLVLTTDQTDVFPAPYFWLGDEDSLYEEGISDVDLAGIAGYDYAFSVSTETPTAVPENISTDAVLLHDAVPNPFNPSTTIGFEITLPGHVRLTIHDVAGRWVTTLLDRFCDKGHYEAVWNGRDSQHRLVPSGVYLYGIRAAEFVDSRRAVLVK